MALSSTPKEILEEEITELDLVEIKPPLEEVYT